MRVGLTYAMAHAAVTINDAVRVRGVELLGGDGDARSAAVAAAVVYGAAFDGLRRRTVELMLLILRLDEGLAINTIHSSVSTDRYLPKSPSRKDVFAEACE
jgi:hypothetical protein